MQRWEHRSFLYAASVDDEEVTEYLARRYPGQHFEKFAPEALEVMLNQLGAAGWELVHILPVLKGKNADIAHGDSGLSVWSNWYFVAMKRPLES
jgi:hypothetical protein